MTPRVRFDRVTKRYRLGSERGNVWGLRGAGHASTGRLVTVLDEVTFELHDGDRFAIVGPNGAGKSTLLRLIAHITAPSSGRVRTTGRIAAMLELGAAFHPDLTGQDNVYFAGSLIGVSRRELDRRYDEIVEFAGLERFMGTPVKRYSSGMAARLGFSVAMSVDADILIIDEALGVGDQDFRDRSAARIEERAAEGATIVLVTHNLTLARSLAHRALHLEAGRVVAVGAAGDILDRYEASAPGPVGAADFVATAPGTLHVDRERVECGGGFTTSAELEVPPGLHGRFLLRVRDHEGNVVGEYPSWPEADRPIDPGPTLVTASVQWFPLVAGQYHLELGVDLREALDPMAASSIEVVGDAGSPAARALIAEMRDHAIRSQVLWEVTPG